MYDNYIYGIFNQNNIQEQLRQQQLQQHHNDQVWKSIKCANKLDEFLWEDYKIDFFAFLGVVFVPLRKILSFQG